MWTDPSTHRNPFPPGGLQSLECFPCGTGGGPKDRMPQNSNRGYAGAILKREQCQRSDVRTHEASVATDTARPVTHVTRSTYCTVRARAYGRTVDMGKGDTHVTHGLTSR